MNTQKEFRHEDSPETALTQEIDLLGSWPSSSEKTSVSDFDATTEQIQLPPDTLPTIEIDLPKQCNAYHK